ncbi:MULTISPECIES: SipW-dependent-type signal peptide-containing protein [Bacteria]|uniref:SipW-dependent-type signal peptide-containing protein n=1 Tax=Bacteria TaxID=2 RepID=UPI003C7974AB
MSRRQRREEVRRIRWRRARAILASGLVLGVGTAVTLAAWNDAEYGAATFTAGRFGIVGATDGSTFTEHSSVGAAATLSFQAPPTAMAPGQTVYTLFSVKTLNPSVAGTVQLLAGTPTGGLAGMLRYGVRAIGGTTCNATSYAAGTAVVPDGSALATNGSGSLPLPADGASAVSYCFAITLPSGADNSAQGQTMSQTWQFSAVSS